MTMAEIAIIPNDEKFLVGLVDDKFLAEWKDTQTALVDTAYLGELWAKSKTPWFIQNVTISWPSDVMNMRYVAAQLEAKGAALREAKFNLIEKQVDVEEAEQLYAKESGQGESSDISAKRLLIRIARTREEMQATLVKFRGAMEEVAVYKAMHDALKEKLGDLTQDAIDAMDHRAQLLRALVQSVRSVRMTGRIDAGNQEFLEQCGCNPLWAQNRIIQELVATEQGPSVDMKSMNAFVNKLADEVLGA
jgi:hypothetical protein